MAIETSPAFQFYVKEWRSSRAIMRMTFAQRGMYLEMLLEQWENLSLPDSAEVCADIIGGKPSEWIRNWAALRRNFVDGSAPGRIVNARLERERAKQRNGHQRASDRGSAGAAARWKNGTKQHNANGVSITQALTPGASCSPPDSFPIAIPVATADQHPADVGAATETDAPPPAVMTFSTVGRPQSWALTESLIAEWAGLYPNLDIPGECRRALAWIGADHGRRKTAKGMPRFLVNWFNRSVASGGSTRGSTHTAPRTENRTGVSERSIPGRAGWRDECAHDPRCSTPTQHALAVERARQAVAT